MGISVEIFLRISMFQFRTFWKTGQSECSKEWLCSNAENQIQTDGKSSLGFQTDGQMSDVRTDKISSAELVMAPNRFWHEIVSVLFIRILRILRAAPFDLYLIRCQNLNGSHVHYSMCQKRIDKPLCLSVWILCASSIQYYIKQMNIQLTTGAKTKCGWKSIIFSMNKCRCETTESELF